MNLGAVVLAAGQSQRMGAAKLVQLRDGISLVAHALRPLLDLSLTQIVVVSSEASGVVSALPDAGLIRVVNNPHPERGLSSSLSLGIAALATTIEAAFIVLADMPCVARETYLRLIEARQPQDLAVIPVFAGRRCNPVLLSARGFHLVEPLRGDLGLRELLRDASKVREVLADDPGVVVDIDTPEELDRWRSER